MRIALMAIGVFLIWITVKLSCNDAVVFKFTNAVCESFNKSWVVIHQCRLRAISRNKTVFNLNGTILHPAYDISLHMQVLKKANGYKPWVMNTTIDVCRFLKKNYNPIAKIVFDLFKEFSNINHSCPLMGAQLIQGFYLRPQLIRHPIPSGDYLLAMTYYFDKKLQFQTNLYFVFQEDL